MVSYADVSNKELKLTLKQYLAPEHWDLNDFDLIISRARLIEERNIVEFKLSFMDLYLDTRDLSFVDAHPYFS